MTAPLRASAAPLAGIAIAAALLVATRGLDQVVPGDQLGPSFWPRLALSGLALTCVARLVTSARASAARDSRAHESGAAPSGNRWFKLGAAIGLILLYVGAAPLVGFAVATAVFIAAFMALCGARSPIAVAVNALFGTVALLYLFVRAVYLPLPKGDGPFEAVTLAVYRALHIF